MFEIQQRVIAVDMVEGEEGVFAALRATLTQELKFPPLKPLACANPATAIWIVASGSPAAFEIG
jgi:hypothetical protein